MQRALELAGFFTAHAVWCIRGGDPYVPAIMTELADGSRAINVFNEGPPSPQHAQQFLTGNPTGADRAVLVMDGYVTLEGWRTDALIVEVRLYRATPQTLKLTLPYTPQVKPKGLALLRGRRDTFKVYRPKFMFGTESSPAEQPALGEAFFRGVDSHKEGSAVWNKHLDQSR